jgi:hypothetical protein
MKDTLSPIPKTDVRYWRERVTFPTPSSRTYAVQIQFAGRRSWIPFHTANKKQAAILARDFYENLRANGWEVALAHRKGAPAEKKFRVTPGRKGMLTLKRIDAEHRIDGALPSPPKDQLANRIKSLDFCQVSALERSREVEL